MTRRSKKGEKTAMGKATKALTIARKLSRVVKQELHAYDSSQVNQTANYTGTVHGITDIASGSGNTTRLGQVLNPKKLEFRFYGRGNVTNGTNAIRFLIVEDTMSLGTIPSGSDILQVTGANFAAVTSQLNYNNSVQKRFKIHLDKVQLFSNTGEQNRLFKRTIKLSRPVHYTGTASGDEGKGMLYLIVFSDVNTSDPTYDFYSRLWFTP